MRQTCVINRNNLTRIWTPYTRFSFHLPHFSKPTREEHIPLMASPLPWSIFLDCVGSKMSLLVTEEYYVQCLELIQLWTGLTGPQILWADHQSAEDNVYNGTFWNYFRSRYTLLSLHTYERQKGGLEACWQVNKFFAKSHECQIMTKLHGHLVFAFRITCFSKLIIYPFQLYKTARSQTPVTKYFINPFKPIKDRKLNEK